MSVEAAAVATPSTPVAEPAVKVNENSNPNSNVQDLYKLLDSHKERVKINGVERELTYQEMKKLAGKAYAADEKFQKASELYKNYEDVDKIFKGKDIKTFLSKAGINTQAEMKSFLEEVLLPIYQEEELEKMNPDAYRAEQAEKELKKIREQREQDEAAKEAKAREEQEIRETQAYIKELDEQFHSAFKKIKDETGVAPHYLYHDMAVKEMRDANREGYELSPYEGLKLAHKEVDRLIRNRINSMKAEDIVNFIGKDGLKKIREFDTKKVVQANSVLKSNGNKPASQSEYKPTKQQKDSNSNSQTRGPKESISDYFERIRSGAHI